jgi:hypothetical protein
MDQLARSPAAARDAWGVPGARALGFEPTMLLDWAFEVGR